jgi:cytochrome c553
VPDAPNLAGNNSRYLVTQLNAFRNGKRRHQQMTIVAKKLTDEEVANLAAWYAAIKIKVEMPKL